MATILKRGTRAAPRFFVKYDTGVTTDGTRVQRMKLLRGVQNVLQARQEAARVERAVGAGQTPSPDRPFYPVRRVVGSNSGPRA
jgi:hypothetical protein